MVSATHQNIIKLLHVKYSNKTVSFMFQSCNNKIIAPYKTIENVKQSNHSY